MNKVGVDKWRSSLTNLPESTVVIFNGGSVTIVFSVDRIVVSRVTVDVSVETNLFGSHRSHVFLHFLLAHFSFSSHIP